MLGVNEHMGFKLFGREIIFEEFQRIWTRYLNVTDGRTDRQLTVASPRSALASHGKKFKEKGAWAIAILHTPIVNNLTCFKPHNNNNNNNNTLAIGIMMSSVCLSVTLFILTKQYILHQKCLNKWIGSAPYLIHLLPEERAITNFVFVWGLMLQIHLHTFPHSANLLQTCCWLVSDMANKSARSYCNGIWETTQHT